MELFKEINYIQRFGSINVQKDILNINPNWQKYFDEIELKNYQYAIVDIYHHSHLDFSGTFKKIICDDYLSKKKDNKFLIPENYLNRYFIGEISILENMLFSKNSQEEYFEKHKKDLEISNFSKHFISLSDDLIYTFEKKGEKSYCFIFLTGFEGKDENYQQDYFQGLYKFLKEDLLFLLNESEISNLETLQEQKKQKKYKYNISAYIITCYLDYKALGLNIHNAKTSKNLEEIGAKYIPKKQQSPLTFKRHFYNTINRISPVNSDIKIEKIIKLLGDDWKNIVLSISQDKKLLEGFLQTL